MPTTTKPNRRGTEVRKRTQQLGVRLLPAEYTVLKAEADRRRITPSEVLRRAFFGAPKAGAS